MVTGGVEISYSPDRPDKRKEEVQKSIQKIIEESGATITHTYIPTDTNRNVDLIYDLTVQKGELLEQIRRKLLNEFPRIIENVSTLVDE